MRFIIDALEARESAVAQRIYDSRTLYPDVLARKYGEDPDVMTQIKTAIIEAEKEGKLSETYQELLRHRENAENEKPLRERQTKAVEEINRKTPDIKTGSTFLDETASTLGRTIEKILGIGRESLTAEMLKELQIANEQRREQNESGAEMVKELQIGNDQRASQTINSVGQAIDTGN